MSMTLEGIRAAVFGQKVDHAGLTMYGSRFLEAIDAAIRERDRLRGDVDGLRDCVERAEAELAALKARIDGSRHAFLGPNMDRITFLADEIGPNGEYALVKVED